MLQQVVENILWGAARRCRRSACQAPPDTQSCFFCLLTIYMTGNANPANLLHMCCTAVCLGVNNKELTDTMLTLMCNLPPQFC